MSGKAVLTIGFVLMVTATGVVHPFDSVASNTSRIEIVARIGHGGSTYQSKSNEASDCHVVGEERIGHGGATYRLQSGQAGQCLKAREGVRQEDVTQRIGHGGTTYSPNQTMSN